jgi:hypothetical protein
MRLDAKSGVRGLLVNVETGALIRFTLWAEIPDDPRQPGEYEAWRWPPDECRRRYAAGEQRESLVVRGRCRLRFVPAAPLFAPRPSAREDLAGSLDEARRRVDRRLLVLGTECSEPLCHRPATWAVSWEQLIEPERDADGNLHERAVCVRRVAYCEAHYRPPRQRSLRGVESEVPVLARPQW